MTTPVDAEVGHILEVDLDYPMELHEAHDSFPMAPQHETIFGEDLSPYAKSMY